MTKSVNAMKNRSEQFPGYGDLRKLEHHQPGMMSDFRADFDSLVPQCRERPMLHPLGWPSMPEAEFGKHHELRLKRVLVPSVLNSHTGNPRRPENAVEQLS